MGNRSAKAAPKGSSGGSDGSGGGVDGGGSVDTFPLLDRLLEELPEVVDRFVLPALDPSDLTMLARTGRVWRVTFVSADLLLAGTTAGPRLKLNTFCVSVQRLAWAKTSGTLPIARAGVCFGYSGRTPKRTEVGAGASLSVGLEDVCICRC